MNEEIPVNKYQKKNNHVSKLVETMFIITLKVLKFDFEVFFISMVIVSLHSMNSG